jgi:hypothetical protein
MVLAFDALASVLKYRTKQSMTHTAVYENWNIGNQTNSRYLYIVLLFIAT